MISPTFSSGANTAERVQTTPGTAAQSIVSTQSPAPARVPFFLAPASPAPRANKLRFSRSRSRRGATGRRIRPIQIARVSFSARSPAPHSIHAQEARVPHQTDPPPDQSPPPNSPAFHRAASVQRTLVSPAPASKAAAKTAAPAPSPAVLALFLPCAFCVHLASQRCLFLRLLLCDSSAHSASLRCCFLSSPPILRPP